VDVPLEPDLPCRKNSLFLECCRVSLPSFHMEKNTIHVYDSSGHTGWGCSMDPPRPAAEELA
jgi:hypothetical protein